MHNFIGSPASIHDKKAPIFDKELLSSKIPILGICYGAQLLSKLFNSDVKKSKIREFGPAKLKKIKNDKILSKVPNKSISWMSHGDTIFKLGSKLQTLAKSEFGSIAIFKHKTKKNLWNSVSPRSCSHFLWKTIYFKFFIYYF